MELSDKAINYKPLHKYSNEELAEFLKNNETTDASVLACICSEILKRLILAGFSTSLASFPPYRP
jgi:hypothetical protein